MLTLDQYRELGLALREAQRSGNHLEVERIKDQLTSAPRSIRRIYLGEIAKRGLIEFRPIRPEFLEELLDHVATQGEEPERHRRSVDAAHVSDVLDDGGVNAAKVASSAVVAKVGSSEVGGGESMHREQETLFQQFVLDSWRRLVTLAARLVGPQDAEDVAQEAFLSMATRIHRKPLAETMPLFGSRDVLWRLMYRITICRAYDHLRRRQLRTDDLTNGGVERLEASTSSPQRELALHSKRLERAYASLPPAQRIVHVLHHFYGFTASDFEETLAISKSNSRALVHRANNALRHAITTDLCTSRELTGDTGDEQLTPPRGLTIPGGFIKPNRVAGHENSQLEGCDTSNVPLLVKGTLKDRLLKVYDETGFNAQEGASLRALEANDAAICSLIAKEAAA